MSNGEGQDAAHASLIGEEGGNMNFEQRLLPSRQAFLVGAGVAVSAAALIGRRAPAADQAASPPSDVLHPLVSAVADLGPPPPVPATPAPVGDAADHGCQPSLQSSCCVVAGAGRGSRPSGGKSVALLGPGGWRKSTRRRLIAGLDCPPRDDSSRTASQSPVRASRESSSSTIPPLSLAYHLRQCRARAEGAWPDVCREYLS